MLIPAAHRRIRRPPARHGQGDGSAAAAAGRPRAYVPLGQVATIRQVAGPMVVRTEDAMPTAWVYVDVTERDIGGYVARGAGEVERDGHAAAGLHAGLERAVRVHAAGAAKLLASSCRLRSRSSSSCSTSTSGTSAESLIVMLSLPFALVGGLWFIWLLGYNWSVAVAIGFIALAGVAAETGVVMLIYLDQAWQAGAVANIRRRHGRDLYEAVMEGAVERVRPKMMTVVAIMAGLLPILWGTAPVRAS